VCERRNHTAPAASASPLACTSHAWLADRTAHDSGQLTSWPHVPGQLAIMKPKCSESASQWPSSFSRSHTDEADPSLPSGAAVGSSVDVEDELEDVVGTSEDEDVIGMVLDEDVIGMVLDEDVIGIELDEDVLRIAVVEDNDVVTSEEVVLATGSSHTSS
jgi:hypothetical protein